VFAHPQRPPRTGATAAESTTDARTPPVAPPPPDSSPSRQDTRAGSSASRIWATAPPPSTGSPTGSCTRRDHRPTTTRRMTRDGQLFAQPGPTDVLADDAVTSGYDLNPRCWTTWPARLHLRAAPRPQCHRAAGTQPDQRARAPRRARGVGTHPHDPYPRVEVRPPLRLPIPCPHRPLRSAPRGDGRSHERCLDLVARPSAAPPPPPPSVRRCRPRSSRARGAAHRRHDGRAGARQSGWLAVPCGGARTRRDLCLREPQQGRAVVEQGCCDGHLNSGSVTGTRQTTPRAGCPADPRTEVGEVSCPPWSPRHLLRGAASTLGGCPTPAASPRWPSSSAPCTPGTWRPHTAWTAAEIRSRASALSTASSLRRCAAVTPGRTCSWPADERRETAGLSWTWDSSVSP